MAISDLTQPSSDDVPKDPMQDNKFVILSEFPEPSKLFPAYSDGQTGGLSDKRDATGVYLVVLLSLYYSLE